MEHTTVNSALQLVINPSRRWYMRTAGPCTEHVFLVKVPAGMLVLCMVRQRKETGRGLLAEGKETSAPWDQKEEREKYPTYYIITAV